MRRFFGEGPAAAVLIATLLILAGSVSAYQSSRIETHSGAVYTGCDFTVDDTYKVIVLKCDDQKRNISFSDVAYIYDVDGNDVSADYLGKYYRPPEPAAPESPAPTAPPSADSASVAPVAPAEQPSEAAPPPQDTSRATQSTWISENQRTEIRKFRPFDASVHFSPSGSIPVGTYYEGMNPGIGFGGEVALTITPEFAIGINVARQGVSLDKRDFESMAHLLGLEVLSNDVSYSQMQYQIFFQYYRWQDWQRETGFWWYLNSGLGAVDHRFSGSMAVHDPTSGEDGVLQFGYSETKFMASFGGGVVPMLSRTVGLDLSFNSDVVFIGTTGETYGTYGSDMQTAMVLDLRIGLIYLFRGEKRQG